MIRQAVFLLAVPVFAGPTIGLSQTPEEAFNRVAARHGDDLLRLTVVRGTPMSDLSLQGNATLSSVSDALARRLSDRAALLMYAPHGAAFSVWLIDRDGLRAHDTLQAGGDDVVRAAGQLHLALQSESVADRGTRPSTSSRGLEVPRTAGHISLATAIEHLTAELFPPSIAAALEGVEQLVIVPTGSIGAVPFALLRPFGDATHLVERMEISIAPSLYDIDLRTRTRHVGHTGRPGLPNTVLAVTDPGVRELRGVRFPELPGTVAEVDSIRGLGYVVRELRGAEATESRVKEVLREETAAILYLATHGVADPEMTSPEDALDESFLALVPGDGEDGAWTAREIQDLRGIIRGGGLRCCVLAVLSACETGLGFGHAGGVIGIARGFLMAGVPRVMMTLWRVDDQATARIMSDFMRQLRTLPPGSALRSAMLSAIAVGESPAHWAPFTYFGVPDRAVALDGEGNRLPPPALQDILPERIPVHVGRSAEYLLSGAAIEEELEFVRSAGIRAGPVEIVEADGLLRVYLRDREIPPVGEEIREGLAKRIAIYGGDEEVWGYAPGPSALCHPLRRVYSILAHQDVVSHARPRDDLDVALRFVATGSGPPDAESAADTLYYEDPAWRIGYDLYARVDVSPSKADTSTLYMTVAVEGFISPPAVIWPRQGLEDQPVPRFNEWFPLYENVALVPPSGMEVLTVLVGPEPWDFRVLHEALPECADGLPRAETAREHLDGWVGQWNPMEAWRIEEHPIVILPR